MPLFVLFLYVVASSISSPRTKNFTGFVFDIVGIAMVSDYIKSSIPPLYALYTKATPIFILFGEQSTG